MAKGPDLGTDALDALLAALASLGVEAEPALADEGEAIDFLVRIGDSLIAGEVKPVLTAGSAQQLVREAQRQRRPMIVVGDRIAEDAKATLRRAGVNYLDRRGELRLFDGPLKIDAKVPSSALESENEPLSSQVAQEVAITCLLEPDRPHGVREVAAYIARAPSAVSKAMAGLRADGISASCWWRGRRCEAAWQRWLHRDLPEDGPTREKELARRIARARRHRYTAGQALYEAEAGPHDRADVVINNDDLAQPALLRVSVHHERSIRPELRLDL